MASDFMSLCALRLLTRKAVDLIDSRCVRLVTVANSCFMWSLKILDQPRLQLSGLSRIRIWTTLATKLRIVLGVLCLSIPEHHQAYSRCGQATIWCGGLNQEYHLQPCDSDQISEGPTIFYNWMSDCLESCACVCHSDMTGWTCMTTC